MCQGNLSFEGVCCALACPSACWYQEPVGGVVLQSAHLLLVHHPPPQALTCGMWSLGVEPYYYQGQMVEGNTDGGLCDHSTSNP